MKLGSNNNNMKKKKKKLAKGGKNNNGQQTVGRFSSSSKEIVQTVNPSKREYDGSKKYVGHRKETVKIRYTIQKKKRENYFRQFGGKYRHERDD